MAESHGKQSAHSTAQPGVDPVSAFWRDLWARTAASAGSTGMPGMPPGFGAGFPGAGDPAAAAAAFLSPDVLRRMQAAFFDAMAQQAEQTMRSPQFLEAMKRSMDQALQCKRQMDDFLKSNMASAFETATGGANTEILGAIRQSQAQLQAHIDARLGTLDARVAELERTAGKARPASSTKLAPAARAASARSGKKSKRGT